MVWWRCGRWMCGHVPGPCCGGTSSRWACRCWSTTTWRRQMRGASGLMLRFRTSTKPPAPTRSSEWRFSWGKDLLSKGGRWCIGHRGIFSVWLSSLEYLLWQFCFCFLQRCNRPLCGFFHISFNNTSFHLPLWLSVLVPWSLSPPFSLLSLTLPPGVLEI